MSYKSQIRVFCIGRFFGYFLCVLNECKIILPQCWIRDGSRSAAHVMQMGCANHPKVLCLKDKVLNVWAKGFIKKSGKCSKAERK